ncbi:sensor histidine kinase [Calidifontibacillus oryziterrae]|uniref:sensor histidine kinase n=1 Tax=Calidifontibacillus oryziterrae TaxID=1191699 RepID=UPI0002ECCF81|nr:ATP-binding protein [Calidifontibacillus oryziterrae]
MAKFDLQAIKQLSEMLTLSHNCTCVLQELLISIVEKADIDLAVIFLKDENGETFVLSCSHKDRFQQYKNFFKSEQFSTFFSSNPKDLTIKFNLQQAQKYQDYYIYGIPLPPLYDLNTKCTLVLIDKNDELFSEEDFYWLQIITNQIGLSIENELIKENTKKLSYSSFMILDSLTEGVMIVNNQDIIFWNQKLNSLIDSKQSWKNHNVNQFLNYIKAHSKDMLNIQLAIDTLQNNFIKHYHFFVETKSNKILRIKKYPLEKTQTSLKTWGIIVSDFTQYKESDKLKDDLIATVSHELRTPLTSIKGNASALLRKDIIWPEEDKILFLQDIYEESDHLNDLIGKLLDFSKINAGALRIDPTVQTVQNFVRNLKEQLFKRYKEKFQQISIHMFAKEERFEIDEQRIIQVFFNLIDNALKHNSSNILIEISIQNANHHIQFTVKDNGIGIPKENLGKIFEKFYQKDQNDKTVGFGLGLAICKGFISVHNGEIWVESYEGRGSSFHFTIPIVGR